MTIRSHLIRSVIAAFVLAAAAAVSLLPFREPAPVAANRSAGTFSAAKGLADITAIASRPHPIGSAAESDSRAYLVQQLASLGLDPQVQEQQSVRTLSNRFPITGVVHNILARWPGTASTGRVLLVAHYDSVPAGPGASDDGLGVATVLGIARALVAGPHLRNDVDFLLTDGEEQDSLGAAGHIAADPASAAERAATVVFNIDVRGTSGPVVMFETGGGSAALVPLLSGDVPTTSSLMSLVYAFLPNSTDMTLFKDAGYRGMNFAVVAGAAHYHTATDDLANVNARSLQQMGNVVLAATKRAAGTDLSRPMGHANDTYFTVGGLLIRYPMALVLPLAAFTLALVVGAIWLGVRRGRVRLRPVLLSLALAPASLLVTAILGALAWELIATIRPADAGFAFGDTYRSGCADVGLVVLAIAVARAQLALVRQRGTHIELALGVLGFGTILNVAFAVLAPAAAYGTTWPTLIGALAVWASYRLADRDPWRPMLLLAPAVVAILLLLPLTVLLVPTAGLAYIAVAMVVAALLTAFIPFPARFGRAQIAILAAAGVVVAAIGVSIDTSGPTRPRQVSLLYADDLDTSTSMWVGSGAASTSWLRGLTGSKPVDLTTTYPMLAGEGRYFGASAPAAAVPRTTATVTSRTSVSGHVEVTLRLSVSGEPNLVAVYVDPGSGSVLDARIGGATLPGGRNRAKAHQRWQWGTYLIAPSDGAELTLDLAGPATLELVTVAAGLPESALGRAWPDGLTPSASRSGQTLASCTMAV